VGKKIHGRAGEGSDIKRGGKRPGSTGAGRIEEDSEFSALKKTKKRGKASKPGKEKKKKQKTHSHETGKDRKNS